MAEVTETNIRTDVPAENQSVERCLTFESGDMTLFLSINNVTEIINDCAITHLPLVPDYIKGIINLRGQILPVVDIRLYMGKPALEYNSKTCFIVLNVDDLPVCIVVDSVQQVIDFCDWLLLSTLLRKRHHLLQCSVQRNVRGHQKPVLPDGTGLPLFRKVMIW